MCLAATHDVELTKTLEKEYDNYHFEESMVKGDVLFSYQLKPGRANSSNAIDLLANLGYDDKLIMAGGSFIEGSTIELSADGPVRPPYAAYMQGGLNYAHVKIALKGVLNEIFNPEVKNGKLYW